MRNKKAQFFGAYLVVLTLMLCGIVIWLFYVQQGNALNSLVSPKVVLDVRDDLDIFEIREMSLIEESLVVAKKSFDFCDDEFPLEFKDIFIAGVLADLDTREFLFGNLTFEGRRVEDEARLASEEFFGNIIYPGELSDCDGDARTFTRASVGKYIRLKASDQGKINFPVDFSFEFEREYLVNRNGEVTKA